jgi:putative aminopeptidase FrvX
MQKVKAESRRECHLCGDLTIRLEKKGHYLNPKLRRPICITCQKADKNSLLGVSSGAISNAVAAESKGFMTRLRDRIFRRHGIDSNSLNGRFA